MQLDEELAENFNDGISAKGRIFPASTCLGDMRKVSSSQPAGFVEIIPDCWVVNLKLEDRKNYAVAFMMPPAPKSLDLPLLPLFMAVSALFCTLISIVVANFALRHVARLRDASTQFAKDIDSPPLPESGPIDIRETYAAFNAMQRRIRSMFKERSEMLAAVSHDLQTPLTRLRLRVETMPAGAVQEKILADLDSMERLVAEGLQLAMAHEANEDWVRTDLQSLLVSAVENAKDCGKDVTLGDTQRVFLRLKPDALLRCLQNLIDNAVFYGGDAIVSNRIDVDTVIVQVDDSGPGIPCDQIEAMFTPFTRGEASRSRNTGGTGIGLSIARAQAEAIGAKVTLTNREKGGLSAVIIIPVSAA
jgi:signal transduction histidine kinase